MMFVGWWLPWAWIALAELGAPPQLMSCQQLKQTTKHPPSLYHFQSSNNRPVDIVDKVRRALLQSLTNISRSWAAFTGYYERILGP
jgi:hypothetical protein